MRKISKKWLIAIVAIGALTGCATPVSKLADDEFVWTTGKIATNYQQTYRNLKRGLDVCSTAFFLSVESNLYTDIGEGELNLYFKNLLGGNNGLVYGLVKLKRDDDGTSVRIGIQTLYAKPLFGTSKAGETILKFASGGTNCE